MNVKMIRASLCVFLTSICYYAGAIQADEQLPPAGDPVLKHFCYVYKETIPASECGGCDSTPCSACDEVNLICNGSSRACSPGKTVYEKKQMDGQLTLNIVTYLCFCDFDCVPEGDHEHCGPNVACVQDMDDPECSAVSYPTENGSGVCKANPY